ncbi:hypothetical protein GPROT2_01350 [Gammaproteobacteria bacterium]|nr:hypothetical protein GPROT2_01350 [Gammaproteobacteria bacterium]
MNPTRSSVLFSFAFRAFFLLAGAYAVIALVLWIAAFHGLRWPGAPAALSSLWHAREMALGFCGAVVAGFLLTAVATWTGRPPLRGPLLMVLVASWLLGRFAAMIGGGLPQPWLAAADLAFPVLLAVLAGREILGGASRRNYGIAAMTWVLAALTLLYHLGEAGFIRGGEQLATSLMVHLLAVLITVVGGRVIPLFTANWLRMRGDTRLPLPRPRLDQAAIGLVIAAGVADGFAPGTALTGVLCIAAGAVNLWRLGGWRGSMIFANPLLWSLHLSYACVAGGYALLGAAALGLPLPRTAVLHLLTIGGVSGMILAMMTRVSLGHTGRPLAVVRPVAIAYVLVAVAALLRSLGPALPGPYMAMIDTAALLWVIAFSIFLVVYTPILTGPRVDQK